MIGILGYPDYNLMLENNMANKVLSIECGRSIVRVIETTMSSKEVKVFHAFSFAAPEGLFEQTAFSEFAKIIQGELKRRKITTKKTIFVINSGRMAMREVIIPEVKPSRIAGLIEANASDYFPVDLSQYILVHEIIEKYKEEGQSRLRLNILAVPNDIVDFYETLAKESGLNIIGMDYTGNASRQIARRIPGEGVKALLKVDGKSSLITIMNGNRVVLQRHLAYGISEAIQTIIESGKFGNVTFENAVNVLRNNYFLRTDGFDDVHSQESAAVRDEVIESIRGLVGSVARIVDYYQSRNPEDKINKLYVMGAGSCIRDLDTYLTNEIGLACEIISLISDITIAKSAKDMEPFLPEYYACIGVAFHRSNNIFAVKKKGARDKKEKTKQQSAASIALYAALSALFILAAGGLYYYQLVKTDNIKEERDSLKAELDSYAYIDGVIAENEVAKKEYEWAKKLDTSGSSVNGELVSLIEELERKMPSDIRISSLTTTSSTLNLMIHVESKKSVAEVIKQLRTFDRIVVGNVSTISEEKSDDGATSVTFSVDLAYVDLSILEKLGEAVSEEGGEQK